MTSYKGRQLDKHAVGNNKKSVDDNDDKKGPLDIFVFSHLIHVEDQKSGLRRGKAYEPKQTMSHIIFVCPFNQNKQCLALKCCLFKLQCIYNECSQYCHLVICKRIILTYIQRKLADMADASLTILCSESKVAQFFQQQQSCSKKNCQTLS